MKTYLVTGGSGFVGSWLIKCLLGQGHRVHALLRNREKLHMMRHERLVVFEGDMSDESILEQAIQQCEGVFHLAAYAKVWAKNSKTYFDANVKASCMLVEMAIKWKAGRVVVTSTAGVYGASAGEINEQSVREFDFFNAYESSKALCDLKMKEYALQGADVVIVSPTRVYGHYLLGKPESVSQIIRQYVRGRWRFIPGDGSKIGNYIYVEDVVRGLILAMERGMPGETYLLADQNASYHEFFSSLATASGVKRKLFYMPHGLQMTFAYLQLLKAKLGGEPVITPSWIAKSKYHWKVNGQKARIKLGFEPRGLASGLQKTIEHLKAANRNESSKALKGTK
jgi:nucleoside-diphosphate-sugar epimerase